MNRSIWEGIMGINVIGGGWVTASGYGRIGDGVRPVMAPGDPSIPPVGEIFISPPIRHRRFDNYCRVGCAAIALALRDIGMDRVGPPRDMGIIASTRYGCFETDLAFYATTEEEGGIYASPNLFSYTLPNTVISEAAIHFRLTGPTFIVGDPVGQRGYRAMEVGLNLIASGTCRTILAGWLDAENQSLKHRVADDDGVRGAVFVALSTGYAEKAIHQIRQKDGALFLESGMRVSTILDLFT
jgi:3-oxoacyl-[acyl-carrier-protein] synthase II